MNKVIATTLFLCGVSQSKNFEEYPKVNLEIRVVDEQQKPVIGITTYAFGDSFIPKSLSRSKVESNNRGKAEHTFRSLSMVRYMAKGNDFYESKTKDLYAIQIEPFANGDKMRHDGSIKPEYKKSIDLKADLVVRRIKNPLPLYAKRVRLDIPEKNQWLGYDLEKGDWVKPRGVGVNSDLLLRSDSRDIDLSNPKLHEDNPAKLEIQAAKGGGFLRVTETNGFLKLSDMKMPHLAPISGYNEKPIVITQSGFERKLPNGKNVGYFFQNRIEKDGDKIIAANYGKIIGIIKYMPKEYPQGWFNKGRQCFGSVEFTYYFNATENDRNLEFAKNKNQLKGLKHGEEVTAP